MNRKKEYKLELTGMSCGSCEVLIKRIASQNGAEVSDIDAAKGNVTLWTEEEKIADLKTKFAEKGFTEKISGEVVRGDSKRVLNYIKAILTGNPQTKVETKLFTYVIGSIVVLLIAGIGITFIFPSIIRPIINILPLVILLVLGVLMMHFSYYHISCYRKNLSCTNGMMIGMTIGMMSGFLAGALVGATNGMFIGSLAGMFFGIVPGFVMGKPAGIMGAMEGFMAGIMSGTMGAMLSVMMINDNLILFLYILFGLCVAMIGALSYMMYKEDGPTSTNELRIEFSTFILSTVFFSAIILFVMIYGPKNGLVFS